MDIRSKQLVTEYLQLTSTNNIRRYTYRLFLLFAIAVLGATFLVILLKDNLPNWYSGIVGGAFGGGIGGGVGAIAFISPTFVQHMIFYDVDLKKTNRVLVQHMISKELMGSIAMLYVLALFASKIMLGSINPFILTSMVAILCFIPCFILAMLITPMPMLKRKCKFVKIISLITFIIAVGSLVTGNIITRTSNALSFVIIAHILVPLIIAIINYRILAYLYNQVEV